MKRFFPVVHCEDNEQIQKNVEIAKNNDADGVFLINHGQMSQYNFEAVVARYAQYYSSENFKIGANFLDHSNIEALEKAVNFGLDMLWVDNAGCDDCESLEALQNAESFFKRSSEIDDEMKIQIFGGVHFKYQPAPKSPIYVSLCYSLIYMDVPTLSGSSTGTPANIEFIQEAYRALQAYNKGYWPEDGKRSLAIASGISVENVNDYLPYIDRFLVASSILDENDERLFDEEKLKMLCETIHSFNGNL